jgi:hypothetical protein
VTAEVVVTTTGFEVGCTACWTPREHVAAGELEAFVLSHHLPVVLAIDVLVAGRAQTWRCRRPRPLRP